MQVIIYCDECDINSGKIPVLFYTETVLLNYTEEEKRGLMPLSEQMIIAIGSRPCVFMPVTTADERKQNAAAIQHLKKVWDLS